MKKLIYIILFIYYQIIWASSYIVRIIKKLYKPFKKYKRFIFKEFKIYFLHKLESINKYISKINLLNVYLHNKISKFNDWYTKLKNNYKLNKKKRVELYNCTSENNDLYN